MASLQVSALGALAFGAMMYLALFMFRVLGVLLRGTAPGEGLAAVVF